MSGTKVQKTAEKHYNPTPPESVFVAQKDKLNAPYQIIGNVKVDRYNIVGVKRQLATINDLMQAQASKIGGNAVIDVHRKDNNYIGHVVKFVG